MSQKRQADSVHTQAKTKMSRVTDSVSRMSDVMSKLFKFQDGSEYSYSIIPNIIYTHINMTVCLFFTGEGENIQVLFAQLPPPPQTVLNQEEEEDNIEDVDAEFVDNDIFETDLFGDDSENDLFVW